MQVFPNSDEQSCFTPTTLKIKIRNPDILDSFQCWPLVQVRHTQVLQTFGDIHMQNLMNAY